MTSPLSPHHSHPSRVYRTAHTSNTPAETDRTSESQSVDSPEKSSNGSSAEVPDLGDDLSAEEQEMIYEQFPPSPETTMRIYGQDRAGHEIQPESLGNRIDLRG